MRNILKKYSQISALLTAAGLPTQTNAANPGGATVEAAGVSSAPGHATVQRVLTFKNVVVPLVDAAGVGAHGATKFFTFDKGQINIIGAVANLAVTKSSAGVNATFNGDFAIGSVAAAADATLTSTEANVIASTSTPAAVAGATTATGKLTTAVLLDGSTTAVDLYLNMLVDDADQDVTTTPCNLILNGTVTLTYANNGAA